MKDVEDIWPLSPLQEGMLFHSLHSGTRGNAYVAQLLVDLEGTLDPAVLRASWDALVGRHASLRAGFRQLSGSRPPVQVIARRAAVAWREVDLSARYGTAEADRLVADLWARPFDLTAPPPVRVLLVKTAPDRHRMAVALHHIVVDGWSMGHLRRELLEVYRAGGSAAGLPPVTPFREYLVWLARQDRDGALATWQRALAGVAAPTLVAPGDRVGGDAATTVGVVSSQAGPDVADALQALARGRAITVSSIAQAAWGALLAGLTGRSDVVFGMVVNGRPPELPDVESMLGLFINTVPVRVRFDPDQPVDDLLARLHAQQTELVAHQYLGLSDIQRAAGSGARFDTLMAYQNLPEQAQPSLRGLGVTWLPAPEAATTYPISLQVIPGRDLGVRLTYRPDLFDDETAQGLADGLIRILERIAADPAVPVGQLPVPDALALEHAPAPAAVEEYRPPATAAEELMCQLFAEILGLDEVGVAESFFALGGDSLLAMRLIARVKAVMNVKLTYPGFFAAATAAAVAELVGRATEDAEVVLARRPRPERVPLSSAQERMWFLNRLEGGGTGAAYNNSFALRLSGELDVPALEAALGDVADRHESLRTVLPENGGAPYQRILSGTAARPPLVVEQTSEEGLARAMAGHGTRGFDVAVELSWRVWLLVLGPTEHVLLVVAHHVVLDGVSTEVLARDLATAYTARDAGRPPDWEPLPIQYADYALWQRDVLGELSDQDSLISGQLGYWREALAGAPRELALPTDRPRPATPSFRGATVPVRVEAGVHARLSALAKREKATTFMVVQAALAVLLSRLGAGKDIVVGTATAGRADAALDGLVGLFVNTLVLRADLNGTPSFHDLLLRVRDGDLAAFSHQDLPFERLVEDLNPERSLARNPLFQIMLSVQSTSQRASWELPRLRVRPLPAQVDVSRFDLSVSLFEHHGADGGIDGTILYATDLFDEATVRAMARRFERVLEAVAADPGLRVSDIDILDRAERHRLLAGWNDTARPVAADTVLELFAQRVERSAGVTAVRCGDDRLSYDELDARANQLARHLARAGAGPETAVGLCLRRGVDVVVALMAVWKAGAAYVPLDPALPADRLAFMVEDSDAVAVLCTAETLPSVPGGPARVLLWDHAAAEIAAESVAPLDVKVGPDHLAYVIYTSGSTGRPKGVAVAHRGVANLAEAMRPALGVAEGVVVLQFAAFSFDAAVLDVAVVLAAGGTLAIASEAERTDPEHLSAMIRSAGVRAASVVPSLLGLLDPDAVPGVRDWVVGAERLSADLASRWAGRTRLRNTYGPTEATVITTATPVDAAITPADPAPPIGRPIANSRVYLLDDVLQPVPAGVTGEIYIAGPGVARGYTGRTGLTAERFVACPFGEPGERMYRSGDLARWTADGSLLFAGRGDDQVKIRGLRVEPGEIEAVLAAHEAVGQVAVVVREDRPGDKRLVAYAVPAAGQAIDTPALRGYAAGKLPDYMVPTLMVLESLPLTPNGKVDRAALPRVRTAAGRGPRTEAEHAVHRIWCELLGEREFSVRDKFFDVGGNSISLIPLRTELGRLCGEKVPLEMLFEHSTIEAMAGVVDRGRLATVGDEQTFEL